MIWISTLQVLFNLNFSAARAKFRLWREDNARKSEEAITLFETILADSMHKLGDESKNFFFNFFLFNLLVGDV